MNAREKENKWKNRLDELFDIAHVVSNEIMTNEKDKEFFSSIVSREERNDEWYR